MSEEEKDLVQLLSILFQVVEANKGVPAGGDARILDAEGLALKFFAHALSTLYLYRGISLPDLTIPIRNFPDPSSLHVVTRAAFESYLVFYYVFIDPNSQEEQTLRYHSWEIAGLYERQRFPATTAKNIAKLKNEKELINEITVKIENNSIYQSFSEKEKKSFFNRLKRGNWRSKSWAKIAACAGFSKSNSEIIYRFLCEHAHSGNISVTQVWQSKDIRSRKEHMKAPLGHLLICVANIIKHYGQYFPRSKTFYQTHFKEPNAVSLWIDIGGSESEPRTDSNT